MSVGLLQRACPTMSCLPQSWGESTKRRSSASASASTVKRARRRQVLPSSEAHGDAVRELLARLNGHLHRTAQAAAKSDLVLEASVMLSSIPFAEHLQRMESTLALNDIPLVSRAYEEAYMRAPMHRGEPECGLGSDCECMLIDAKTPFVGVQFPIPSSSGKLANNLCIFCLRKITLLLFYETLHKGVSTKLPIQKFGNIPGQPNEYHASAMLMCPKSGPIECMPLPIVAHQRNKLSVEVVGNVPHVRQHGVYMEDF